MIFKTLNNNLIDVKLKKKHLMISYDGILSTYSIYDLRIGIEFHAQYISDDVRLEIEKWVIDNTEYLDKTDERKCDCFLKINTCYCKVKSKEEPVVEVKIKEEKTSQISLF